MPQKADVVGDGLFVADHEEAEVCNWETHRFVMQHAVRAAWQHMALS